MPQRRTQWPSDWGILPKPPFRALISPGSNSRFLTTFFAVSYDCRHEESPARNYLDCPKRVRSEGCPRFLASNVPRFWPDAPIQRLERKYQAIITVIKNANIIINYDDAMNNLVGANQPSSIAAHAIKIAKNMGITSISGKYETGRDSFIFISA